MVTDDLGRSLPALFGELVYGAPRTGAFVLNPGDAGLLNTLDQLGPEAASTSSMGGGTIAAHADHLRFGLSLLNRWAAGENPFADADWSESWKRGAVTDVEWAELREGLRAEVDRWHSVLGTSREVTGTELDGVIGSIAHVGYHLGAIRQILPAARGPRDSTGS
jgi:hypothetical protein